MIYGITLIVLGILAAPSLLLSKKPDAKEMLDKITPYQGWIGLAFCAYGIYGIIFGGILRLSWLADYPIWWITALAGNLVKMILQWNLK